jgi:rhodanese-related sulfurtransferase
MLVVVFLLGALVTLGAEWGLGSISSAKPEAAGTLTFPAMVSAAQASVPVITAEEAYKRVQSNPNTLILDPRDAADIAATTGLIKGAANISYGTLTYKADNQVPDSFRDPRLADRSRPIITACYSGELGLLAAKLLKDMGFTNVSAIQGGTVAWKTAGYPMQ